MPINILWKCKTLKKRKKFQHPYHSQRVYGSGTWLQVIVGHLSFRNFWKAVELAKYHVAMIEICRCRK